MEKRLHEIKQEIRAMDNKELSRCMDRMIKLQAQVRHDDFATEHNQRVIDYMAAEWSYRAKRRPQQGFNWEE